MNVNYSLSSIEHCAAIIRMYVGRLSDYVELLTAKRSYLTRAEDDLATLETELTQLLGKVKQARKLYAQKPVSDHAA